MLIVSDLLIRRSANYVFKKCLDLTETPLERRALNNDAGISRNYRNRNWGCRVLAFQS